MTSPRRYAIIHLAPLLREKTSDDDPIDLSSVELSHYRLSKTKQQDLRLNELFITDGPTERDLINYAQTIADKVLENAHVMH